MMLSIIYAESLHLIGFTIECDVFTAEQNVVYLRRTAVFSVRGGRAFGNSFNSN